MPRHVFNYADRPRLRPRRSSKLQRLLWSLCAEENLGALPVQTLKSNLRALARFFCIEVTTYAPIVSLRFGSTLNAEDIKEGDDVYFECQIKSNPMWTKLTWIHNGGLKKSLEIVVVVVVVVVGSNSLYVKIVKSAGYEGAERRDFEKSPGAVAHARVKQKI
ncbi:hypothetical protein TSAR_010064 [Trichomalopsis sarcophagae]|uniref:Ig-like domain-containing protein n=1 Tax=Trichomalopsis sarcophagae TaxID=543379 RepID=A0A232FJR8_9HYME|nr:hypothetical protein TSAR_010064 [Trichomalopsis sarcophagae]